ncbi:hypothetical protein [Candidatus Enterococcus mansonii]|uniref:Uncharacterized protein n=1 Tax=Candidatus Enterococcus mansonii TaxID=1834181 RepID=A0A242C6A1_9ENTE|nr:hypothetical protein [Enterococcus sp. 4G2_DIV0659]OTO05430.1 hypothetical protein A5880_002603 [Enterococcus sp. 4G2_DIV0659]
MKQILGILSVIIVLGAVIFVFFGQSPSKDKPMNTSEGTKETTTSEVQTKQSTTTTTTAGN